MGFYDLIEKIVYFSADKKYSRREVGKGVIIGSLTYLFGCSKKEKPQQQDQKKEPEKKDNLENYLSTLTNEDP